MLPEVTIDIGFSGSTTSDVFTVGDSTLGQVGVVQLGEPYTWVDVSPYVRRWSIRRGASRGDDPTLRFDPGTATIELNDGDRRFDPENLAGPYVSAGVTQIEPMRRVRIRAVWNSTTYNLFYGYSDDFKPQYQGNAWTYTILTATDANKIFASYNRDATAPVGSGENGGQRFDRIINAYGWTGPPTSNSGGSTALQATTLAGNMLDELQLTADTEQGQYFVDAGGRPTWRNRQHILTFTKSKTSQATFGDGGYVATGEIPYADAIQSTPGDNLINVIQATCVGGTEQVVTDAVSVGRYLAKTHTRSDLIMTTDAGALQWAYYLKYQYSNTARRFARLELVNPKPEAEAAHWPAVLAREFSDRITVIRRPAGGGDPIDRDCFVRGIEHESDGAAWRTAFVLAGADRYSFFVVGDAVYGRVGYNAVAY